MKSVRFVSLVLSFSVLFSLSAEKIPAGFAHTASITINTSETGAATAADVYNFPLLISLDPTTFSGFANTKDGGDDIRFTKADGTLLPHGIELWADVDSDADTALIWVKVDTVKAGNASQFIIMHYGNPAATSASSTGAVFDTADGYLMMTHCANEIASAADSVYDGTYFMAHGVIANRDSTDDSLYSAPAQIGNGIRAMGAVTVRFPRTMATDNHTAYSMSAWFRPRSVTNFQSNIIQTSNLHSRINLGNFLDSRVKVHVFETLDLKKYQTLASEDVRVNRWHHAVLSVDSDNKILQLYVDGMLAKYTDFAAKGVASLVPISSGIVLAGGVDINYNGYIDQGEFCKVPRDSNWVKLAYATQKSAQTVVSIEDGTHAKFGSHVLHTQADERISCIYASGRLRISINHDMPAILSLYNPYGQHICRAATAEKQAVITVRNLAGGLYYLAAGFSDGAAIVPVVIK